MAPNEQQLPEAVVDPNANITDQTRNTPLYWSERKLSWVERDRWIAALNLCLFVVNTTIQLITRCFTSAEW